MKIESILKAKGTRVETTEPAEIISRILPKFMRLGIGALVVSSDGTPLGLLSERDVVAGLHKFGARVLDMPVSALMSRNVPVCSPEETIQKAMAVMTRTRNRHIPVVSDGRLAGIVSLGDVVKHRLEEVALETSVLRDAYIAHR